MLATEQEMAHARWVKSQELYLKTIYITFDNGTVLPFKMLNITKEGLLVSLLFDLGEAFIEWDRIVAVH